MSGRWGRATVLAVLTVDCGHHVRGTWLRVPTADYTCVCGHHAEASGDAVREFVRTAREQHKATCPQRGEVAQ